MTSVYDWILDEILTLLFVGNLALSVSRLGFEAANGEEFESEALASLLFYYYHVSYPKPMVEYTDMSCFLAHNELSGPVLSSMNGNIVRSKRLAKSQLSSDKGWKMAPGLPSDYPQTFALSR